MHTVLPLRFFCNSLSGLLWGHQVFSSPYFLFHYKLLFFSPWYPLVPVEKKYETSLSSLPFLRLRFVLILAKNSLLAIERPVVALPLFSPFLHMFPLIVTLIKTNERFTSMKHVASITHTYLSQYIAIYCFPVFVWEGFPILTLWWIPRSLSPTAAFEKYYK